MARPTRTLTAAQMAEVETLAAVLTVEQMADYFGVGRTTFFAMIQRDPGIGERYKRGKARAIGAIAQSLIAKARGGDTASMIFFLKTQAGWRETARLEHSGPDSGPVVVSDAHAKLAMFLAARSQPPLLEDPHGPLAHPEADAPANGRTGRA